MINTNNKLYKDDLRHHITNTSHVTPVTNNNHNHVFATILAHALPGDNRFEKLNYVNDYFKNQPGFLDLDWKFHNGNANIFVEFNNRKLLLLAIDNVLLTNPNYPLIYLITTPNIFLLGPMLQFIDSNQF